MEIQSLPQYRGLPDALRAWGEPDEKGRTPTMRLRDYLILALIIMICVPTNYCLVVQLWVYRRNAEIANTVRQRQLEEEGRRTLN